MNSKEFAAMLAEKTTVDDSNFIYREDGSRDIAAEFWRDLDEMFEGEDIEDYLF